MDLPPGGRQRHVKRSTTCHGVIAQQQLVGDIVQQQLVCDMPPPPRPAAVGMFGSGIMAKVRAAAEVAAAITEAAAQFQVFWGGLHGAPERSSGHVWGSGVMAKV